MRVIGAGFVLVGVALLLASFFGVDTAPRGTHNIGLLQEQMMIFQLGAVTFLAGVVFIGLGHLSVRISERSFRLPASLAEKEHNLASSVVTPTDGSAIVMSNEESKSADVVWVLAATIIIAAVVAVVIIGPIVAEL